MGSGFYSFLMLSFWKKLDTNIQYIFGDILSNLNISYKYCPVPTFNLRRRASIRVSYFTVYVLCVFVGVYSINCQNDASISNFRSVYRWLSEYPWCIIEVKSKKFPNQIFTKFVKIVKNFHLKIHKKMLYLYLKLPLSLHDLILKYFAYFKLKITFKYKLEIYIRCLNWHFLTGVTKPQPSALKGRLETSAISNGQASDTDSILNFLSPERKIMAEYFDEYFI
ncbi:hypothetical protein AGLY_012041 [Aphis glycines]|uniref:Uncharacterized protein n=1 Tax=Aphis glycines TaxID=307491 RepID=A0A6G0TAA5_APHGL|nr:hypothetical protein AGLY_012041 [Aphis glycines]